MRLSRLAALFVLLVLAISSTAQAATLSLQTLTTAGIAQTLSTASATGDACLNDGTTFLRVRNSSGANAYTLTLVTPQSVNGVAVADVAVTIATSGDRLIGPFPTATFNDGNSLVSWTYTGTAPATDLTVGCFDLPRTH